MCGARKAPKVISIFRHSKGRFARWSFPFLSLGHVSWYPPAAFVFPKMPASASLASDEFCASSILSFVLEHWILRNVNHSLQPTLHLTRQQAQAWLVLPGQVKTLAVSSFPDCKGMKHYETGVGMTIATMRLVCVSCLLPSHNEEDGFLLAHFKIQQYPPSSRGLSSKKRLQTVNICKYDVIEKLCQIPAWFLDLKYSECISRFACTLGGSCKLPRGDVSVDFSTAAKVQPRKNHAFTLPPLLSYFLRGQWNWINLSKRMTIETLDSEGHAFALYLKPMLELQRSSLQSNRNRLKRSVARQFLLQQAVGTRMSSTCCDFLAIFRDMLTGANQCFPGF